MQYRDYPSDVRWAFSTHKSQAKRRGIPWRLTIDEWWDVWRNHWPLRGTSAFVMARDCDCGAYAAGNVRITTRAQNNIEKTARYRETNDCVRKCGCKEQ